MLKRQKKQLICVMLIIWIEILLLLFFTGSELTPYVLTLTFMAACLFPGFISEIPNNVRGNRNMPYMRFYDMVDKEPDVKDIKWYISNYEWREQL